LRRLLPTLVLVFPIFGFAVFEGEHQRVYSLASGLAFFVLASVVVLVLVVLSLAKRLNRLDRERRAASIKAVRLAALVDASNDAIMSSDAHGMITTCNPALEELYGYTEGELIGQPVSILTPPDRRLEQVRLMEAAARGEATTERDTQRLHKNGSLLDVSVTFSRVMEAGSFYGCCVVTHDITRRVQAQDRLEEAVRDRTHELSRSRAETLHSLALAAEYHDYETALHTTRVGESCALLAAHIGLSASFVELIRQAAPLHDVGKIGIPDHILLKPSALTSGELDVMKEHTILGSRLLARSHSEVLQLGEVIALAHHERWDGKGYPAGLAGEAIPIAGRIVAVADTFDAMTHDRPYRSACSVDEALTEISNCSGSQFDPRVAEAIVRLRRQIPHDSKAAAGATAGHRVV
jgi:PAS domain S-box-containing protein